MGASAARRRLLALRGGVNAVSFDRVRHLASLVTKVTEEGVIVQQASPYASGEHPVYGNILWDSGTALSKFFAWSGSAETSGFVCLDVPGVCLKSKDVLDLGTGTGIVALTAAKLGARVTATDC